MVDVSTATAAEMFRSPAPSNLATRPYLHPECSRLERFGTTGNLDLIQKPGQAW